jgi:hypothetical protein
MKPRALKLVKFNASEIASPSPADRQRVWRAFKGPVDTSEIREVRGMKRHGPIWNAIADAMQRQGLSGHALWKLARVFSPQMPESAVYEFLADKRSVRVEYADAMLQALGVRLISSRRKKAG